MELCQTTITPDTENAGYIQIILPALLCVLPMYAASYNIDF